MSGNPTIEEAAALVSLTARRVQIFQPPRSWEDDLGGGRDIDCIVDGLDPTWPLRLPSSWRLCQVLRYRSSRYQWWLERNRDILIIDTTNDPPRTLESGISSARLLAGSGLEGSSVKRAIYLTKKRLFKWMLHPDEWQLIARLAKDDVTAYSRGLVATYGRRCARDIARCGLEGTPPDEKLAARARRARLLRYATHPHRALPIAFSETSRIIGRVARPTGLAMLVVGPDGSGKSTVAGELVSDCGRLFRRQKHIHWRPGLLPRLGGVVGRAPSDATQPHARTPHGRLLGYLVLLYYWFDFLVGGWLSLQTTRIRTGLVVQERGWWDLAVDPLRYRLRPYPRTVLALGKLLPRPDIVVVLESDADALHARKPELNMDELQRQVSAWRELAERVGRARFYDTSRSLSSTVEDMWQDIATLLESRCAARVGKGWTGLGTKRFRRWLLPRGPRRAARSSLAVYQPVTPRGRFTWMAARTLAGLGSFRLLPHSEPAPRAVREMLTDHVPAFGTIAFARANHPGRYLALILGPDGDGRKIAKLATDEAGARALGNEAEALSRIAPTMKGPVTYPELLHAGTGVLVLGNAPWRVRRRPWFLPREVAFALGEFFRQGADESTPEGMGASHGDFAPWNLLDLTNGRWMLIDWEEASRSRPPFWDVLHYLVQGHVLLGRPSETDLLKGLLDGDGWVSEALGAYADGAGVEVGSARSTLAGYLEASKALLDPNRADEHRAIEARSRLLAKVGG